MERPSFHPPDDEAVILTNDDASECKRHAVKIGYWKDDYIGFFVKNTERKAPEINRGYYARIKAIQTCIEKVLEVRKLLECYFFSVILKNNIYFSFRKRVINVKS